MLQPRKLKYRKLQKGRSLNRQIITKGTEINFGEVGLKSLETKMIASKELEAAINEIKRNLKGKGRLWLRVFPQRPKTKKPPETRMGGGKGDVETYVALVRPGTIIFEVSGSDRKLLKEILKKASYKLSVKTKIVEK